MGDSTIFERIRNRAEELRDATAENLSRLVRIPSLSCREGEVAKELALQMREAGFDDVAEDGLGNVIGRIGHGEIMLALDAHIDTVDVGNRQDWEFDPYCGEIRDGWLLGRGSVDQKGGAAAMVTAGRIVKELNLENELTVLAFGTVMEEDSDGLCWKYIIEEDKLRPAVVISTEPTNLSVHCGQRGRMEIEAEFHGLSAHGSAPERGRNAIYMASRACLAVEELNGRLARDEFLGSGSVTVSELVSSAPSLCAVADYAKIHLDRRLTWGETKASALAEIERIVEPDGAKVSVPYYHATSYTGALYGMEKYYPTWKLPPDHPAVLRGASVFEALAGRKAAIGRWLFSTNGVAINGLYGIPTIGFGPGDESYAHAPNEKTPVSDLVIASAFYAAYAYAMREELP